VYNGALQIKHHGDRSRIGHRANTGRGHVAENGNKRVSDDFRKNEKQK